MGKRRGHSLQDSAWQSHLRSRTIMGTKPRSGCRNFLKCLELQSCEICIHIHANHMQITPPPDQLQEGKAAACPSSPGSAPPTQPSRGDTGPARDPTSMSPALGQWTSEETEMGGENVQMDLSMSRAGQESLWPRHFQSSSLLFTEGKRLCPGREPGTQAQYSLWTE